MTGTGRSRGVASPDERPDPEPSFSEVLAARRMCRDFTDVAVDGDSLERVLRSAFRGPSAGNADALDLLVLDGDDVGGYWALTLPEQRRADFPWPGLLRAPVLVLAYVSPQRYVDRYGEADKARSGLGAGAERWAVPYWWVDGGAAVMAVLLAAEAEGLGALLFGQFDHEEALARRFGVPADRRSLGTIALGHRGGGPSMSGSARRGRPEPSTRLHRGGWQVDRPDR